MANQDPLDQLRNHVQELHDLLSNQGQVGMLDLAALQIATLEFPDLDCAAYMRKLDSWAEQLRRDGTDCARGTEFVRQYHDFFFDQLGFHGNSEDYYNPQNSFLNLVIDRRTGIPISLAVLYTELARRIGKTAYGIGFPGHFLVRVNDDLLECYVDVFNRGRLMTAEDCLAMGRELTGVDYSDRPEVLEPIDARSTLIRMLSNLRGVYITRKANRKLLAVLDLLLLATPENAEEYFTRAMVKMNLHQHASAERDLQHFLKLRPEADNKGEIEHQLQVARLLRSQMN